ncbi:hypothetical protein E1508_19230 [Pseudomonas moraviensis]|nr:hypothetical protein E1508_19230 [Pseudomonas moraviensis]
MGASLLANTVCLLTNLSADTTHSRAGSLPHWYSVDTPNRTGPDTSAGACNGHIRVTVRMNSKVAADVLLGPSVASSPGSGEKSCLTRLSGRQRRPL